LAPNIRVLKMIKFYMVDAPYGEFSNFDSKHPIFLDGKMWKSTEHYFQAKKFTGTPHEEEVRQVNRPRDAANAGRDRKCPLRKDWESVKDNIMRRAVYAKFAQHDDLKKLLLSTGTQRLIEHTVNDNYWADGGDGSGKNMLGMILMEVRSALQSEEEMLKYVKKIGL
jgi:ribA/ribD-fused uncharacterized protein